MSIKYTKFISSREFLLYNIPKNVIAPSVSLDVNLLENM